MTKAEVMAKKSKEAELDFEKDIFHRIRDNLDLLAVLCIHCSK